MITRRVPFAWAHWVLAARRAGAATLRDLAAALSARGVPAPAGGHIWHPQQVKRVLVAAAAAAAAPQDGAAP